MSHGGKRPGAGRRAAAGERRVHRIEFRISDPELAEVEDARGEISLSDWYRDAGLERARRMAR